ncbi:hypothetical protein N2152v2_011235 [Parachlorella kessleri]
MHITPAGCQDYEGGDALQVEVQALHILTCLDLLPTLHEVVDEWPQGSGDATASGPVGQEAGPGFISAPIVEQQEPGPRRHVQQMGQGQQLSLVSIEQFFQDYLRFSRRYSALLESSYQRLCLSPFEWQHEVAPCDVVCEWALALLTVNLERLMQPEVLALISPNESAALSLSLLRVLDTLGKVASQQRQDAEQQQLQLGKSITQAAPTSLLARLSDLLERLCAALASLQGVTDLAGSPAAPAAASSVGGPTTSVESSALRESPSLAAGPSPSAISASVGEAIVPLEALLRVEPYDPDATCCLAGSLCAAGQEERAMEVLEAALNQLDAFPRASSLRHVTRLAELYRGAELWGDAENLAEWAELQPQLRSDEQSGGRRLNDKVAADVAAKEDFISLLAAGCTAQPLAVVALAGSTILEVLARSFYFELGFQSIGMVPQDAGSIQPRQKLLRLVFKACCQTFDNAAGTTFAAQDQQIEGQARQLMEGLLEAHTSGQPASSGSGEPGSAAVPLVALQRDVAVSAAGCCAATRAECARLDWPRHRPICQALAAMRRERTGVCN